MNWNDVYGKNLQQLWDNGEIMETDKVVQKFEELDLDKQDVVL